MELKGLYKVKANLKKFDAVTRTKALIGMDRLMTDCENDAKHNAPWTDRTGNARNSIYGRVIRKDATGITGALGIGIDYGVFLEFSHEGKYRIIFPTIESHKRKLLRIVKTI